MDSDKGEAKTDTTEIQEHEAHTLCREVSSTLGGFFPSLITFFHQELSTAQAESSEEDQKETDNWGEASARAEEEGANPRNSSCTENYC